MEGHPPEGLGVDLDTLRKVCRDDVEALDIIDRETRRPAHRPVSGVIHSTSSKTDRPTGTSADQALSVIEKATKELQPHGGDRRSSGFKVDNINLE